MYRRELTEEHLELLHGEALKVLQKIGLCVEHAGALQQLKKKGLKVVGSRVYMEPEFVEEQLSSIVNSVSERFGAKKIAEGERISLGVCDMPQYYRNPLTDKVELMTARNLVQATQFMETVQDCNVWTMVPGVPRDVPQQLQAITEYYIGAMYSSSGGGIDTLYPEEAIPYIFEMADIMERPFSGAGMFTISPLKVGGFEFGTALKYLDRFDHFYISSAPTMGVGSPVYPSPSWVVSIAEVLGGGIVLHLLSGGRPVMIGVGMFPFDMRSMAVVGGAPEYMLMEYHRYLVTRRYNPTNEYTHTLTTMSKDSNVQAGAEKACGAAFAAMNGCRSFNGAGLMSFDDIFSPAQLMADIEIRDLVERLIRTTAEPPVEDWFRIIEEGYAGGFMDTDTTLEVYRDVYYFPRFFDRSTLHSFMEKQMQNKTMEKTLQEQAAARIASYNYQLAPDKAQQMEKVYRKAWSQLAPGAKNPLQYNK